MYRSSILRKHSGLVLAAALGLTACSGDDAVPQTPPHETPSSDEPETSGSSPSSEKPAKPATTGSGGTSSTKPMDGGVKVTTGKSDAGSTTDTPTTGLDGSTAGASTPDVPTSGRPVATSLSFPITTEAHAKDEPIFNITRPTDLAQPGGLLPVIVWANGGCFRSDFTWSPLFKRWAAAGFVVLSLASGSDDEGLAGLAAMLGTTTKTEHGKLIDWVVAQDKSGPYAGKLDLARIVIAGNSCGGVTALEVASADKRVAAVFVLSGSSAVGSVNKDIMSKITVPVGYVVGGEEDIAGANATGDYEAMKDGLPGMIVNRREGDHQTVSTDEKILPEDAEIALNWMDLALYGTKQAYEALTSKNVCDKCTPGDWTLKSKHLETLVK